MQRPDPTISLQHAWIAVFKPPWRYAIGGLPVAVLLVYLVAWWLPGPLGGLLIMLSMPGLWLLLFALASRLLLNKAAGVRLAREADAVDTPPGVALRHVLLWLLASLVIALAHAQAGSAGLILVGLLLALALPGATLVLSDGQPLSDALYPPEWLKFARELGVRHYLVLSGWLTIYTMIYLVLAVVLEPAAAWLRNALQMFWWSAALMAWFAQAGSLLHAHRAQTRPTTRREPGPALQDPAAVFDQLMRYGGSCECHRQLARTLEALGDDARALAHGQVHVTALLLSFERPIEALEQADRLLGLDEDFCLDDPVVMRRLIQTGRELAPPSLLVRLCRNYLARFPSSLVAADIHLLACETLAGAGLLHTKQARAWLAALAAADLDAVQRGRLSTLLQGATPESSA